MLRLTAERLARGWSQNRLAQEARLTPSDVSKITNGRMIPYPGQLAKMATALGWPAERSQELMEEAQRDELG